MGYDGLLWVFAGLIVLGFAISLRGSHMGHYRGIMFQDEHRRLFPATEPTGAR